MDVRGVTDGNGNAVQMVPSVSLQNCFDKSNRWPVKPGRAQCLLDFRLILATVPPWFHPSRILKLSFQLGALSSSHLCRPARPTQPGARWVEALYRHGGKVLCPLADTSGWRWDGVWQRHWAVFVRGSEDVGKREQVGM